MMSSAKTHFGSYQIQLLFGEMEHEHGIYHLRQ
jgi:hypothetical protein